MFKGHDVCGFAYICLKKYIFLREYHLFVRKRIISSQFLFCQNASSAEGEGDAVLLREDAPAGEVGSRGREGATTKADGVVVAFVGGADDLFVDTGEGQFRILGGCELHGPFDGAWFVGDGKGIFLHEHSERSVRRVTSDSEAALAFLFAGV